MTKFELAEYLVDLHTLMSAQASAQHSIPSRTLEAEYNRGWDQLKELITNEAGQSTHDRVGAQAGADLTRR